MDQFDVLSIGDVVTDDFIKLLDKEEKVEHEKNGETWLAIPFGTKIPFDHRVVIEGVGNAANGAVAFSVLVSKPASLLMSVVINTAVTLSTHSSRTASITASCVLTPAKKVIIILCSGTRKSAPSLSSMKSMTTGGPICIQLKCRGGCISARSVSMPYHIMTTSLIGLTKTPRSVWRSSQELSRWRQALNA